MSKRRVGKTVQPKAKRAQREKQKEIEDIIAQMMGHKIDADVVAPKYESMMRHLMTLNILFSRMSDRAWLGDYIVRNYWGAISKMFQFSTEINMLGSACQIEKKTGSLSKNEMDEINSNPSKMQELLMNTTNDYDSDELRNAYFTIRDSAVLDAIFSALNNLKSAASIYEKENNVNVLESVKKITPLFVIESELPNMMVLDPITPLCFKAFFLDPKVLNDVKSKYLGMFIVFSNNANKIMELLISPDINVDRFVDAIAEGIEKMKSLPGLSDCNKAFTKILNSMDMFRENYSKYHMNFIKSKNPGDIIDGFLTDVAEREEMDLVLFAQLKKIMNYFRNRINKERTTMDPNIVNLFDTITRQMDEENDEEE